MEFRRINESDRPTITDWIAADPYHSVQGMDADFFFVPDKLALALENGCPGLYLRIDEEDQGTVRLHIQFGPDSYTSGQTMLQGWPTFLEIIKSVGTIRRMVFESVSPRLILFCHKRFGFNRVAGTNDYELWLTKENDHGTP